MGLNSKYFKIVRLVGSGSIVALLAIGMMLIAPQVTGSVYAGDGIEEVAALTNLNVESMVTVALQSEIDINVLPSETVTFASNTAKLTVGTNNYNGYSVYVHSAGETTDLVSTDATNKRTVAPIAENVTLENFATNTWGYSLDAGEQKVYRPVMVEVSEAVVKTDGVAANDQYDLTFGVAVGSDLPMGTYSNSVVVSVIANPSVVTNLEQATYMQEMTGDICKNTAYDTTKRLIDSRDGTAYWVAKLKDGNCWMTQNLALEIPEEGLSWLDTDITEDWTLSSTYPPTKTLSLGEAGSSSSQKSTSSWNFGKGKQYVLTKPNDTTDCGSATVMTQCTMFQDVSGLVARTKLTTDGTIVDETSYDAHYLLGNRYAFGAATAGTGGLVVADNTNATGSICPKGWKLPQGGNDRNSGSFYYLLNQYGLTSSTSNSATGYNIAMSPLYLFRGGSMTYQGGFSNGGYGAHFWTNTAYSNSEAYYMSFAGTMLNVSSYTNRYRGFQVRCVVKSN